LTAAREIGVLILPAGLRVPPPPENLFTAALVGPAGPAVPKSIASVNLLIAWQGKVAARDALLVQIDRIADFIAL